jgi:hypothetical protein
MVGSLRQSRNSAAGARFLISSHNAPRITFLIMRVSCDNQIEVEPSESGWAELFMGAFLARRKQENTGEIDD